MEYITLSHVALNCSDYETSLVFYRDILGLKQKFSLYNSKGGLWLTYMEASPGVFVELFPSGGRKINKYNPKTATGHHFCLLVDDIEQAARELQEKGVEIYDGPKHEGVKFPVPYEKVKGKTGDYSFFIADPDDNPVEIMQCV